jgi:hypothetical protein
MPGMNDNRVGASEDRPAESRDDGRGGSVSEDKDRDHLEVVKMRFEFSRRGFMYSAAVMACF